MSGTVTSFGQAGDPVNLTLSSGGNTYETTSTDGNYRFGAVAAGTYTLTVSKKNHTPRTYSVSLGSNMTLDVKLHLIGDVTGDGNVNMGDISKLYAHIRNTAPITDAYQLLCGNATDDNTVNMGDISAIYSHIKGTKKLY